MPYINSFNVGNVVYDIRDKYAGLYTASAYSNSNTYAVGDMVTYDGKLYKCNTAIPTAEAWTPAHWTETTIAEETAMLNAAIDNIEPWKAWVLKYLATKGSVSGGRVTANFKGNVVNIESTQSTTVGAMIILSNTPRVYIGTQGNFTPLESDLLPIDILATEYIKLTNYIKSDDAVNTDRYCTIGIRTFLKNDDSSFTPLDSINTLSANAKANTMHKPVIGKIDSTATHFLVAVFFIAGLRVRTQEIVYSIESFNMDAITTATQALVLENIGG